MWMSRDRVDDALEDGMGMGCFGAGAITDRHQEGHQDEEAEPERTNARLLPEPEDVLSWKN